MKNKWAIAALIVSLSALGTSVVSTERGRTAGDAVREPVYERVMRTRTIRCSYEVWPPFLAKDPNTGALSGVYFDLMEKLGRDLNLKIDWAEEVGAADAYEGIRTRRTDLFCSAVSLAAARAVVMDFTRPLGYEPFYLFAREGDRRFDGHYAAANDPSIRLLSIDGYIAATISRQEFPHAKLATLPNMTTDADVFLSLASGKADAAVGDPIMAQDFMKHNPGKIRQVGGPPIRYPSLSLALPLGEDRFRALLNTALTEYIETGAIDAILNRNGLDATKILRPAKPFE